MPTYAAVFEPARFSIALPSSSETWWANWKLAMENAMESCHLFKVHKETLETITPSKQAYYIAGSSGSASECNAVCILASVSVDAWSGWNAR